MKKDSGQAGMTPSRVSWISPIMPATSGIFPQKKKAAALVMVLVVVFALTSFGGVLFILAHNRVLMAELEMDRAKALFLAEAGLAQAIFELKSNKDATGDAIGVIHRKELGGGYFSVTHQPKTSSLRAIGVVNGVSRTVQIQYAVN